MPANGLAGREGGLVKIMKCKRISIFLYNLYIFYVS